MFPDASPLDPLGTARLVGQTGAGGAKAVGSGPPDLLRRLTREFRLVAACCAWPPSSAADEAIAAIPREPLDWTLVTRLAARHRVEGLVSASLERVGAAPPGADGETLKAGALEVARRSLTHAAESVRIQSLLDDAGLANLLLKGSAVETLAYGSLGRKDAWDIDLLVSPTAVGPAMKTLDAAGYDLSAPADLSPAQFETYISLARECELRHRSSGLTVELHWGLADGPVLLPGLSFSSPSQWVDAGALRFRTFAREELFAYLCVHGAMHGWSRLKWLADLAALVAGESDESLAALVERSRALGAGAAPDQALILARHVLGLTLGPRTVAVLRQGPIERWLVRAAMRVLAGGGACEPSDDRFAGALIFASQFALCGSWRGAGRQLAYRGVSVHDRVRLPLPPALHILYPLLRGPLWLGRRLNEL